MDNRHTSSEYFTIDLKHVCEYIRRRLVFAVLVGIIAAVVGFCVSSFMIPTMYSSSVKLYVNNSPTAGQNSGISSSEITAAKSLVRTYGNILDSRSTLELVKDQAGVKYSWSELSSMIDYSNADDTEIMLVTVTCPVAEDASAIADTITAVLPQRIADIIKGATMEIVDPVTSEVTVIAPGVAKYTVFGFVLGFVLCVFVFFVISALDDTIHDEEYVLRTYDCPILGKVPSLTSPSNKSYAYYSRGTGNSRNR